ncbi:MAG: apolipoprotein N-acyltransferase [bacterium]
MAKKISIFGAVISSMILFVAFPGLNQWYLIFIFLIPFLLALEERKGFSAFGVGYIFGIHITVLILYSIMSITLAGFIMLLIYLSFYYGAFAFVYSYLRDNGIPVWLSAPFTWTSMEIIMSLGVFGFTLLDLPHALYKMPNLLQIASLSGMWGLTFIIVLINSLIFLSFRDMAKINFKYILSTLIVIILLVLSGLLLRPNIYLGERYRVATIQGNIEQDVKWDSDYREITLKKFINLTNTARSSTELDMVIWPETSIPFNLGDFVQNIKEVEDMTREGGFYLLSGIPYVKYVGIRRFSYNSAILISDEGRFMGRYDKMHLVPFSERIPWQREIPVINKVMEEASNFTEGRDRVIFSDGRARFGVLICFESIFPEHSINYIKKGANLLVVITNDAWFGRTTLPHLHASASCLRAVETHRWIARCANTGVSTIISPDGKMIDKTEIYVDTFINDYVYLRGDTTFFVQHQTKCKIFFILGAIILLLYCFYKNLILRGARSFNGARY